MPRPNSAALPIAHLTLRVLIIVNLLSAIAIFALLVAAPTRDWLMQEFNLSPSPDTDRLVLTMRGIAALGLLTIPLNHIILTRLSAMVGTVRAGDPFVAANAQRLQRIAWSLLGLQLLGIVIGWVTKSISTPAHPVHLDAAFSTNGWLAVLLTFILARVFAHGTAMRDDLEGTV